VPADLIEVKADPDALRQDSRRNRDLIDDVSANGDRDTAYVRDGHFSVAQDRARQISMVPFA